MLPDKSIESSVLIDSGASFLGPTLMEDFERFGYPKMHFVTHSHFDHLGSTPYIKRKLGIDIFASQLVGKVLDRGSAV